LKAQEAKTVEQPRPLGQ